MCEMGTLVVSVMINLAYHQRNAKHSETNDVHRSTLEYRIQTAVAFGQLWMNTIHYVVLLLRSCKAGAGVLIPGTDEKKKL